MALTNQEQSLAIEHFEDCQTMKAKAAPPSRAVRSTGTALCQQGTSEAVRALDSRTGQTAQHCYHQVYSDQQQQREQEATVCHSLWDLTTELNTVS